MSEIKIGLAGCPSCGAPLPSGASGIISCSYCGASVGISESGSSVLEKDPDNEPNPVTFWGVRIHKIPNSDGSGFMYDFYHKNKSYGSQYAAEEVASIGLLVSEGESNPVIMGKRLIALYLSRYDASAGDQQPTIAEITAQVEEWKQTEALAMLRETNPLRARILSAFRGFKNIFRR